MLQTFSGQVDPLPEVNFGKDLGSAISYNLEEHLTVGICCVLTAAPDDQASFCFVRSSSEPVADVCLVL